MIFYVFFGLSYKTSVLPFFKIIESAAEGEKIKKKSVWCNIAKHCDFGIYASYYLHHREIICYYYVI